jgi:hypothetical protein
MAVVGGRASLPEISRRRVGPEGLPEISRGREPPVSARCGHAPEVAGEFQRELISHPH